MKKLNDSMKIPDVSPFRQLSACLFTNDPLAVVKGKTSGMSSWNQGSWLCCLPCYWLKRNDSFHRVFLTIVTLLVTVLLVASPVIFLISSVPGDKSKDCLYQGRSCTQKDTDKVCLQEECFLAANRISASISWQTNPCQDFYHFACGSWKKKVEISKKFDSKMQPDPFVNFETLQKNVDQTVQRLLEMEANSEPFQKLGLFYKSCIRAGDRRISLLPMLSLLDNLGGYVAPGEEPFHDATDLILNLLELNGTPLFDVYLDLNPQDPSKLVPIIDLPVRFGRLNFLPYFMWHLTEKEWINEFQKLTIVPKMLLPKSFAPKIKAYDFIKASMEEKRLIVMERIMKEFMSGNLSAEEQFKEIQSTLLFTNTISKIYPRDKDLMKNYQQNINSKFKLEDLQKKYSFIRWQYLLENFLKVSLSPDDYVFTPIPNYLDSLQRTFPRFPSRIVHNGLLLIFAVDSLYELLNSSYTSDRPLFCTKMTVNLFSKAVSVLYVRQYEVDYTENLRTRVTNVFNVLKKTFEKRVRSAPWLDENTRKRVVQKLIALQSQFLNWPDIWNATAEATLLEEAKVDSEDFFENVIYRYRQLRNVSLNYKQHEAEEKRWAYPFVVNAFYVLTMNTIIIPLAVLTQPYFKENVPSYIPYSTVGLILAHEILHGFDLKGIGYNSSGYPEALLSSESRARLEARLDCFVKQFSSTFWKKVNFLGRQVDIEFDWNMTKNENMADISGLQIAYQAWKSVASPEKNPRLPGVSLNPPQLFFLNAAQTYCSMLSPVDYIFLVETDTHTPHPERVNGIMMNSPGFAEAYSCLLGSPMNPKKKCFAW